MTVISNFFTLRNRGFFSMDMQAPWEHLRYYCVAWMNSVFLIIFHRYLRCSLWISSIAKSWRTACQGPLTQTLGCLVCTTITLLIVVLLIGFFAFRSRSTEESWNKRKCTGKLVKIKTVAKTILEQHFGWYMLFSVLILGYTIF